MSLSEHRAGFVGIIGNPNVGKSTLMNRLVGERLSIVTSKAQTTRHRILGIVSTDDYQIVFSDTPGMISPAYEMQEKMMDFVKGTLQDADVLLHMVTPEDRNPKNPVLFDRLQRTSTPVLTVINKIDLSNQTALEEAITFWEETLPKSTIIPISATENFNTEAILAHIVQRLPVSPPYYSKDSLTDKPERFFVNEIIRKNILVHYQKEIPYAVEVETEYFKQEGDLLHIHALIYVERESQKGIIIGHKGQMLTKVSTDSRTELSAFFGTKIFLNLRVKVNKDWRKNKTQLKKFGYES